MTRPRTATVIGPPPTRPPMPPALEDFEHLYEDERQTRELTMRARGTRGG